MPGSTISPVGDLGSLNASFGQVLASQQYLGQSLVNLGSQISDSISTNAARSEARQMAPFMQAAYADAYKDIMQGNPGAGMGKLLATSAQFATNPFLSRISEEAAKTGAVLTNSYVSNLMDQNRLLQSQEYQSSKLGQSLEYKRVQDSVNDWNDYRQKLSAYNALTDAEKQTVNPPAQPTTKEYTDQDLMNLEKDIRGNTSVKAPFYPEQGQPDLTQQNDLIAGPGQSELPKEDQAVLQSRQPMTLQSESAPNAPTLQKYQQNQTPQPPAQDRQITPISNQPTVLKSTPDAVNYFNQQVAKNPNIVSLNPTPQAVESIGSFLVYTKSGQSQIDPKTYQRIPDKEPPRELAAKETSKDTEPIYKAITEMSGYPTLDAAVKSGGGLANIDIALGDSDKDSGYTVRLGTKGKGGKTDFTTLQTRDSLGMPQDVRMPKDIVDDLIAAKVSLTKAQNGIPTGKGELRAFTVPDFLQNVAGITDKKELARFSPQPFADYTGVQFPYQTVADNTLKALNPPSQFLQNDSFNLINQRAQWDAWDTAIKGKNTDQVKEAIANPTTSNGRDISKKFTEAYSSNISQFYQKLTGQPIVQEQNQQNIQPEDKLNVSLSKDILKGISDSKEESLKKVVSDIIQGVQFNISSYSDYRSEQDNADTAEKLITRAYRKNNLSKDQYDAAMSAVEDRREKIRSLYGARL